MKSLRRDSLRPGPTAVSLSLIVFLAVVAVLPDSATSREIELQATTTDSLTLAGTLFAPGKTEPFPVVVFTHGSEPGVRSHPGYHRWMEAFRKAGIGVLIFDKRGCGDSEGVYIEAPDLAVPAADLLAWVDLLWRRPDVAGGIGVLGWSQGGWVGPLAASRSDRIAVVVAISGSGVSPLEQNIFDKSNQCRSSGATVEQTETFRRVVRLVWTYLVTGEGRESAQVAWDGVSGEAWFEKAYNGPPMMDRDRLLSHPRMTSYVAHSRFDPAPVLERVSVPMLAVFGEEDRIVPVERSIEAMETAFRRSGNKHLSIFQVPGADHGIRVLGADGERTLAQGYPDIVVRWVADRFESTTTPEAD